MAKAKRLKRIDNIEPAIYKLRGGGYELDLPAANGQRRTRPRFKEHELELAKRRRSEFVASKTTGDFRIIEGKATFGDALEMVRTRPREARLLKGSRDGFESGIRTLNAEVGTWKLTELVEAELKPLQDFLIQRLSESESNGRLTYIRTLIVQAFKIAVRKKWLARNPLDDFDLILPFKKGQKRPTLSLAEISALARAALTRDKRDRHEITWSNRRLLFFLTLLTPMRNEEVSGLCWDRLNMVHCKFLIDRIVREGDDGQPELVDDTKTGQSGERTAFMPPFLVPLIEQHRQLLIARGMPVEGRIPLLVTGKRVGTGLVTSAEITRSHFTRLADKAGVKLPPGLKFYIMRHTATNLLKSVGMNNDQLLELGGWESSRVFDTHYRHPTPEYEEALEPEVRAMALRLGLDLKSRQGLVDALGYVFVARWNHEGIKVQSAPQRQRKRSPLEAALLGVEQEVPALASNILMITGPSAPTVPTVMIRTSKQLREYQNAEVKRLRGQGMTNARIAVELGIDHSKVREIVREMDISEMRTGHMPRVEHQTKLEQLAAFQAQHPLWGTTELAKALNVRPGWVTRQLRLQGKAPPPRKMVDYKLGPHESKIRHWAAEGKTFRQMERLFKLMDVEVTFSAIAAFAKKHGIKTKRWGKGERADQYDDAIIRLHAGGKDGKQIAHQLPISHASVCNRIRDLGLNTPAERKANAARARAKKAA